MKFKKIIIFFMIACQVIAQEWAIKIETEINLWGTDNFSSDEENYIGVDGNALDEYDILDVPEPPHLPNNYITMYFPHPEWESDFSLNFTQDIKLNDSGLFSEPGKTWYGEIYSDASGEASIIIEPDLNFPNCDYSFLIDEIELNVEPHMLVTTNNDENLVITSGNPHSIVEISLNDQIVKNSIMLDSAPHDILFSEKYDLVLVALPHENIVVAVDLNNFELINNIDVGDYPHSMNISPDGLYLYVSNTASDNVSVIDLKKLIVVSTIPVGKAPTDIVFYLPNSNSTDNINNNEIIDDDSETEFDASRYTCGAYIHVRD